MFKTAYIFFRICQMTLKQKCYFIYIHSCGRTLYNVQNCSNLLLVTFNLDPRSRSLIIFKDNRFIHLYSKFHEDISNQSKVINIWNFWVKTFIFGVFDQKMHKMILKCHKRCHFNEFWRKTATYLQKWWN